mgnify:CR=1 FL=1
MLFHSFEFIFGFLVLVVLGFAVISKYAPSIWSLVFMVVASLIFYGWWDWNLLWVLVFSVVVNYVFGCVLERRKAKWLLVAGIMFNVLLLGWYKYAVFFSGALSDLIGVDFAITGIVLPLAISFFTFQQIAYLVDVHSGLDFERSFVRYALFVVFFPQLIAGPIVHHADVLPQFNDRQKFRVTLENLGIGLTIFSIGLFKKIVIADSIGIYPDLVFEQVALGSEVSFLAAWVASLSFLLQVYFDFSGYSDMAIGLARMFGIVLPQNFNSPLKARSIIDFWQRWHITLTHFLNSYVFNTLMFREIRRRIAHNLPVTPKAMRQPAVFIRSFCIPAMITMFLIGVWHGAGYQFFVFGLVNGFTLVVNHAWKNITRAYKWKVFYENRTANIVGLVLTIITINFTFVIFRAQNMDVTLAFFESMIGMNGLVLPQSYASLFAGLAGLPALLGIQFGVGTDANIYPTLLDLMAIVFFYVFVVTLPNTQEIMREWNPVLDFNKATTSERIIQLFQWKPGIMHGVAMSVIFLAGLAYIVRRDSNAFIYFQF